LLGGNPQTNDDCGEEGATQELGYKAAPQDIVTHSSAEVSDEPSLLFRRSAAGRRSSGHGQLGPGGSTRRTTGLG
jgi:hypothetical protein